MISKTFIVDDYVMVGNKKFSLNLNVYRNAHYQTLNKAKIIFKNQLLADYPELSEIKGLTGKARISYNIIPNDKRKFDTMNIISVVDKFFLDALVAFGCITDDNYNYIVYNRIFTSIAQSNDNKKIKIKCNFY
jgi:hypothetical protein